jgi:hypothetical protein
VVGAKVPDNGAMNRSMRVGSVAVAVAVTWGIASCSSDDDESPVATAGKAGGGAAGKGGSGGAGAGAGASGSSTGGSSAGRLGAGGSRAGASASGGVSGTSAGAPNSGGTAGDGGDAGDAGSGAESQTDGYSSGSRLRAVLEVAGSVKHFVTWHDTELDIDCSFALDAEGTERCLPGFGVGFTAYSDDQCKKPVLVFGAADARPAYVQDPKYEFTCGQGAHYLEVGDTTDVAAVFADSGGDCIAGAALADYQVVATLGAPVADSIFVAAAKAIREPRDERVAANVRIASDGSREVTSFFDLGREAECNPLEHAGAGYACVPWDRAYIEVFFSDATCETPAAYHPAYAQQVCGRPPTIIQESIPDANDTFFEVGDEVLGTVYRDDGATCEPYESFDAGATYFGAGDPVPWSSFAPFSAANEGTGRIRQVTLRGGGDVLIARREFFDSALDTPCGAVLSTDGQVRCLPQSAYTLNFFADSACTEGLVGWPAGDDTLPPAGTFFTAPAADLANAVFERGAKIAAPAEVWQFGSKCESAGPATDWDWYETRTVAPSELALVTRELD